MDNLFRSLEIHLCHQLKYVKEVCIWSEPPPPPQCSIKHKSSRFVNKFELSYRWAIYTSFAAVMRPMFGNAL